MFAYNNIARTIFLISRHYRARREAHKKRHALLGKTARTLICFIIFATLPYMVSGMERYRVLIPSGVVEVVKKIRKPEYKPFPESGKIVFEEPESADTNSTSGARKKPRVESGVGPKAEVKIEAIPGKIEDPSGSVAESLYDELMRGYLQSIWQDRWLFLCRSSMDKG